MKYFLRTGISILLMLIGLGILFAAALYTATYIISVNLLTEPTYLKTTYLPTPDFRTIVIEPAPADPADPPVQPASQDQGSLDSLQKNSEGVRSGSSGYSWFPSVNLMENQAIDKDEQVASLTLNTAPIPTLIPYVELTGIPPISILPFTIITSLPEGIFTPTPEGTELVSDQSAPIAQNSQEQPQTGFETPSATDLTETVENQITSANADGDLETPTPAPTSETTAVNPTSDEIQIITPSSEEQSASSGFEITPSKIVMIKIPRLQVERPVVEIGLVPGSNGELEWDTDSLFATRNRSDLVGHLAGSALPGEGGNIVLAGHNYDWGKFQWNGVFNNLKRLKAGDRILILTEAGDKLEYVVNKVKQIPFSNSKKEDLSKHLKFMGPKDSEQLTLVTCGGANFFIWNKRVYVSAVPLSNQH